MSSSFDISSIYNSYASSLGNVSSDSLTSSLGKVGEESTEDELMEVCKDFEAYFVQKMLEQAKKTLNNEDEQGEYMQYFSDTLNQSYAELITDNGGIGLAQMLYDSMKTTYNL